MVGTVDAASLALVGVAAFAAGLVNAIAGGGSLLSFPTLIAVGLSPVAASVTNTIALCPGYLGATLAQRRDLAGQRARMMTILPGAIAGGVAGALLLLSTDDAGFDRAVPFLILLAAGLLAVQDRVRGWLLARQTTPHADAWAAVPVALAAVYGGYFGAGMGVMILAALGVVLADALARLNALKQTISLAVNVAAAAVFVGWGGDRVHWPIAGVMLVASLAGGALGGMVASRISANVLRGVVVVLGVVISAIYFARW
ncbi:MAG: sulfite exporter TauE/SafE family protein [Kofleriaceae bacterium]